MKPNISFGDFMSEANTQDLQVEECTIDEGSGEVLCRVSWKGETTTMAIESILNEINKTSVFAHGTAVAAQRVREKR